MKKKIVMFCFFVVMILCALPAVASNDTVTEQPESIVGKGYLLIRVFTYTPGSGVQPYQGANISIRGLFYSYNGTTDEDGECSFTLHTKLFRPKIYFVQVSIEPQDQVRTKRDFVYMQPLDIEYKTFLFFVSG